MLLSPVLCDVMMGDDDSISIDSRNKFKFSQDCSHHARHDYGEIAVMSFIIPRLLVLGLIMKRVLSLYV